MLRYIRYISLFKYRATTSEISMGRFRHLNFRLARLCGIQSKVSQENFAKAWHQQGHQVETAQWLCLIILWNSRWFKGCCYDDRIGWSGHPVFSFLSPTIRDWFQELQNQRSWWIWWKKKTGRCTWRAFWSKAIEFTFLCYLRSCFISFHVD